jgi:hypothetical protein
LACTILLTQPRRASLVTKPTAALGEAPLASHHFRCGAAAIVKYSPLSVVVVDTSFDATVQIVVAVGLSVDLWPLACHESVTACGGFLPDETFHKVAGPEHRGRGHFWIFSLLESRIFMKCKVPCVRNLFI